MISIGKYYCEKCNYKSNKCDFEKHISSIKHNSEHERKEQNYICQFCPKKYTSMAALRKHNIKCTTTNVTLIQPETVNVSMQASPITADEPIIVIESDIQYIYLLQEREFIKTKEKIYKVGKTRQVNYERFRQYPKGSVILLQSNCTNCEVCEKNILSIFRNKFIKRKDIGSEYFEGNSEDMKFEINKIIYDLRKT
jgi:hypothetical protein